MKMWLECIEGACKNRKNILYTVAEKVLYRRQPEKLTREHSSYTLLAQELPL